MFAHVLDKRFRVTLQVWGLSNRRPNYVAFHPISEHRKGVLWISKRKQRRTRVSGRSLDYLQGFARCPCSGHTSNAMRKEFCFRHRYSKHSALFIGLGGLFANHALINAAKLFSLLVVNEWFVDSLPPSQSIGRHKNTFFPAATKPFVLSLLFCANLFD